MKSAPEVRLRARLARWPHWMLAVVLAYAAVLALALAVTSPVGQPAAYHAFADERSLLGIPRAGDVLSNVALLAAGLAGLWVLRRSGTQGPTGTAHPVFTVFFAAVALTGLGSAYYHWAPDDARLVWDRLPLSVIAAAFPMLVLFERAIDSPGARRVLALWLLWAPLTVLYWIDGEGRGAGDLRPYFLVQQTALLGTLLLLALLPARHTLGRAYLGTFALYVVAGICEHADRVIFAATGWISGHTLKHIVAGAAVALLAWMVARRQALPASPE